MILSNATNIAPFETRGSPAFHALTPDLCFLNAILGVAGPIMELISASISIANDELSVAKDVYKASLVPSEDLDRIENQFIAAQKKFSGSVGQKFFNSLHKKDSKNDSDKPVNDLDASLKALRSK